VAGGEVEGVVGELEAVGDESVDAVEVDNESEG